MATNLTEAAALATRQVQIQFETPVLLRIPLAAWLDGIVAAMNTPAGAGDPDGSIAQRTVYNQVPIGREILEQLPLLINDQNQQDAGIVGVYVYRTCKAAVSARAGGRISVAQRDALLAQFNLVWP